MAARETQTHRHKLLALFRFVRLRGLSTERKQAKCLSKQTGKRSPTKALSPLLLPLLLLLFGPTKAIEVDTLFCCGSKLNSSA